jgi:hypothetical protein
VPRRKLSIALCIIQTVLTAFLTLWADRVEWLLGDSTRTPPRFLKVHLAVIELRQIWRGVNAPTFPVNLAGRKPFQVLGLSMPEILYLVAVAALWYLVGHFREQRKMRNDNTSGRAHPWTRIVAVAILIWGAILFALSVLQMPDAFPWTFAYGRIFSPIALVTALLYGVWSLVLIRFGVGAFNHAFRTAKDGTAS